jgi:hypothetical protein
MQAHRMSKFVELHTDNTIRFAESDHTAAPLDLAHHSTLAEAAQANSVT